MIFLFLTALYTGDERVVQLQNLVEVTQRTPVDVLLRAHEHAAKAERGACAAGSRRVRLDCLLATARKFCDAQPSVGDCLAYEDVIISNVLAEQQWVPTARRYEIMAQTKNWRGEVAREVRRKQAALAADLRLRTKGSLEASSVLARAIDRYCTSSAFETGLSWQICAASLVWFTSVREAK